MKQFVKKHINIYVLLMGFILILSNVLTKKSLSGFKMTNKNGIKLKKQYYSGAARISQIGTTSNENGNSSDRAAETYGKAGEFSKIPNNHPIITVNDFY